MALIQYIPILPFAAAFLSALATPAAAHDTVPPTLYARLGGAPFVRNLASDLIDVALNDPRTRRSLEKINVRRLKEKIAEQLCALTHGPCTYDGDDMKLSHAGHNITEAEFYGMVEELIVLLDRSGIGMREKNELLALLAPMKRDIVTR